MRGALFVECDRVQLSRSSRAMPTVSLCSHAYRGTWKDRLGRSTSSITGRLLNSNWCSTDTIVWRYIPALCESFIILATVKGTCRITCVTFVKLCGLILSPLLVRSTLWQCSWYPSRYIGQRFRVWNSILADVELLFPELVKGTSSKSL